MKPVDAYFCVRPALSTIKNPMHSNPQVMFYLHDKGKLHAFYVATSCKSVAGLKRHMLVHKAVIPQKDIMNPAKTLTLACYICHRPCRSAAGLKSHLWSHARGTAGGVDSNTGAE